MYIGSEIINTFKKYISKKTKTMGRNAFMGLNVIGELQYWGLHDIMKKHPMKCSNKKKKKKFPWNKKGTKRNLKMRLNWVVEKMRLNLMLG